MEVEVSGESLDCSRYRPFALIADYSHVVHLDGKGAHQWAPVDLALSLLMPHPIRLAITRDVDHFE